MSSLGTRAERCGPCHPYFSPPNAEASERVCHFSLLKSISELYSMLVAGWIRSVWESTYALQHARVAYGDVLCPNQRKLLSTFSYVQCRRQRHTHHTHTFASLRLAVQLQANKQPKQTRGALSIPQMPFFKYFPYGTGVCCERGLRVHRTVPPPICCCLSNFFATFAGKGTY